jgi:hypothetical protein
MSIMLFFTGFSFLILGGDESPPRLACAATGIYLFMVVYSPGAGPVPFTYSAESFLGIFLLPNKFNFIYHHSHSIFATSACPSQWPPDGASTSSSHSPGLLSSTPSHPPALSAGMQVGICSVGLSATSVSLKRKVRRWRNWMLGLSLLLGSMLSTIGIVCLGI